MFTQCETRNCPGGCRRADGSADRFSSGSLVDADGTSRHLGLADFRIEVLETWPSPRDGTHYPSRWRITIPDDGKLPAKGIVPTVIQWDVPFHPADALPRSSVSIPPTPTVTAF